jgi:hypothetical protein
MTRKFGTGNGFRSFQAVKMTVPRRLEAQAASTRDTRELAPTLDSSDQPSQSFAGALGAPIRRQIAGGHKGERGSQRRTGQVP